MEITIISYNNRLKQQRKKEGKDQESIQLNTTPDQEHHMWKW